MHYTVLVFGPDAEEQMAPFCEDRDAVLKMEGELYAQRVMDNPDAPVALTYFKRYDITQELSRQWHEDILNGKNAPETFAEHVYDFYWGDTPFIPKSVHLKRPEVSARERAVSYNDSRYVKGGTAKDQPTTWDLWFTFGPNFVVMDAKGGVEQVVEYSNNAKWDWYELGGRWRDFFKLKPGVKSEFARKEVATQKNYEDLIYTNFLKLEPKYNKPGYADAAYKYQIDIDGMREEGRQQGYKEYDQFHAIVQGRPFKTYVEVLDECGGDHTRARAIQDADPVDRDIRKSDFIWLDHDQLAKLRLPREEYAQYRAMKVFVTYSKLTNGVWSERSVWNSITKKFDDLNFDEWANHINQLIEEAPDDVLLSVYDYHS